MAELLTLDYTAEQNGAVVNGIAYVSEVTFKPRRNDPTKMYVSGTFKNKNKQFTFQGFDEGYVEFFKSNGVGTILDVSGTVNEYKGYVSIVLRKATVVTGYDKGMFVASHDIKVIFDEFNNYLKSNFDDVEMSMLNAIFSTPTDGFNRFTQEFAGKAWHDGCRGGLMYHTLKMLRLFDFVIGNDYRFAEVCEKLPQFSKLCRLGIILHDLGKVVELEDGQYTAKSIVSHRVRAVEYCARNRQALIDKYTEDGYDILLSIVAQHHGVMEGEAPKTVYAYMVHIIDMLDAQATHLIEGILSDANSDSTGMHYVAAEENLHLYY